MPPAPHPAAKSSEDPDFGTLICTYDYEIGERWAHLHAGPGRPPASIGETWETRGRLPFLGAPRALVLVVHTADWSEVLEGRRREGEITARQRAALAWMRAALPTIETALRSALVQHYHDCLRLIDYGDGGFAPVVFRCRCDWEDEHGFTATFEDGRLSTVE